MAAVMTDNRDRQRSKVYAWEERFVAARDPTLIGFAQVQGMVDAIWAVGPALSAESRAPATAGPLHLGRRHAALHPVARVKFVVVAAA